MSPEILNCSTDINPSLGEFEVELFDGVQNFLHVFEGLATSLGGLTESVPLIAGRLAFSINSLRCDSIQVVAYFPEIFPLYLKNFSFPNKKFETLYLKGQSWLQDGIFYFELDRKIPKFPGSGFENPEFFFGFSRFSDHREIGRAHV